MVVGGGKSGWNKLLGKPAVAAKDKAKQAAELKDATNLHKMEQENDECRWAEDAQRIRAAEEATAKKLASEKTLKGKEKEVVVERPATVQVDTTEEFEDEEEEEEHGATHGMFSGAGKFLLAGGLAGAGKFAPFARAIVALLADLTFLYHSLSYSYRTIRPTQGLSHYVTFNTSAAWVDGGPHRQETSASQRGQHPCCRPSCMETRRWCQGVLDWKRAQRSQDLPGSSHASLAAFEPALTACSPAQESAIKFLSYESAKRIFAEYWDHVPDQTLISNSSRFVAGGIGGVISQFGECSCA